MMNLSYEEQLERAMKLSIQTNKNEEKNRRNIQKVIEKSVQVHKKEEEERQLLDKILNLSIKTSKYENNKRTLLQIDSKDEKLSCIKTNLFIDNTKIPVLKFIDNTYCTVSNTFTQEDILKAKHNVAILISGNNPYCMVISLYVENQYFFYRRGFKSPHSLICELQKNPKIKNSTIGEMFDITQLQEIEKYFNVHIPVLAYGSNWNPNTSSYNCILNPISLANNHYYVEGLG